jgi:hypothetical protein
MGHGCCEASFPDGSNGIRKKNYRVLVGGNSDHAVDTSTVFNVGFLKDVLLLPSAIKIGYNIISAGQLDNLHTVQSIDGTFSVVNMNGDDHIFYLDDMNLLLHPAVVKPTRRLQVSIARDSTAMSCGKRRIRRRKVNIVIRSGSGIDLKGVERNPPIKAPIRAPSVRNTKSRVDSSPTESTTGFTTPKRIAADIDDRDDIDSTSDIEDRTVYADTDCSDSGTDDDDNESGNSQYKSTVSFTDIDEIKDYDVDSPVVAENEMQTSGGASSNAKEEASNEVDISQQDKDHRPRKHTKFREYSSQPSRFRDDSNIMNFLHVRLGHQSDRIIKLMFKYNMITFLKDINYDKIKDKHSTPCATCESAKSSRRPSVMTNTTVDSLQPFQIVCSDIIGKFST